MMLHKAELLQLIGDHTEEEIRAMLCRWLDCQTVLPCPEESDPPPNTSAPSGSSSGPIPAPLVVVDGSTSGDQFTFMTTLAGPKGTQPQLFLLDTGAFEMLLPVSVADTLGLPMEGETTIEGVTGNAKAYLSHATVEFNATHVFQDVSCVVMEGLQSLPLFGFHFWRNRNLAPFLDPAGQWLAIFQAGAWKADGQLLVPAE